MRIHSLLSTAGALSAAIVFAVGATASDAHAQNLAARVRQSGDGTVRFSFAARDGVCGNGRNSISTRSDRNQDVESECETGPVMVALTKTGGNVTSLRTYVGARWKVGGADVTQLGTIGARDAVDYLLGVAEGGTAKVAEQAIFPATLADSVTPWPRLLRLARDESRPREVRSRAVFWVGQAASEEATKGLAEVAEDASGDREVRKSAVFALSQQKANGVESLLRIARENKDKEIRKQAIFWLGQSKDPRALDYFESVLVKR
ncbi:MAG: hypothetical protein WC700_00990 [Gemmatimonadaceae bacterium]|jgi:hypothetical protein